MSRVHTLLAGAGVLATLLLTAGSAHAQAAFDRGGNQGVQERSRADYDPKGLRFGGFDVRPSLELGAETSDNLFAAKTNKRSDLTYLASPRVEIASHWSRHSLRAELGARQSWHQDYGSEDVTTSYAGAEARLDVRRSTQLGLSLRAERDMEPRASPDAPAGAQEPIEFDLFRTHAFVQQTLSRVRLSALYDELDYDYHDGVGPGGVAIDEDFRDRSERVGTARVEYALSPRFALVGQGQWNERAYDVTTPGLNLNSTGDAYMAGANFDLTHLVRGEVTVGSFTQKYEDPAIGRVSGTAVAASIDWFPTQLTTVRLSGERSVNDAGFAPAASFLLSRAGVRLDHELRRNVILSASAEGGSREYRGVDRDDDFVSGDVGARYLVNRNVVLSGGYRYEHQASAGLMAGGDYVINRFFVSIGLRI